MTAEQRRATLDTLTATVPAGSPEAFEAWRWAVSPQFVCDALEPRLRSSYRASIWSAYFEGMILGESFMSGTLFERTSQTIARFGIDDVIINAYQRTRSEVTIGNTSLDVAAGDIVVLDLSREVTIRPLRWTT
jgi:hypothetical protein